MPFSFFFVSLYIEMPETVTVNYIKCKKGLKFSRNCLKCQVYQKQIHLKCSWLSVKGFLEYKGVTLHSPANFVWTVVAYSVINMFIMVKNVSFAPGVISPVIRNVCVGLSSLEYKMLSQESSNEPWFCRCCKKDMYRFYDLTNTNFLVSWNQTAPVLFQTILISPNLYCTVLFAKK